MEENMKNKTNEELQKVFRERLIQLRDKNNLTQTKLGEKLGVKQSVISIWEKGESVPDSYTVKKICECFNTSSDYLLGLTNDDSSKDVQFISDYTGLTKKAVENLYSFKWRTVDNDSYNSTKDSPLLSGLNEMLEAKDVIASSFLYALTRYTTYKYPKDEPSIKDYDSKEAQESAIIIEGFYDEDKDIQYYYTVPVIMIENDYLDAITKIIKEIHKEHCYPLSEEQILSQLKKEKEQAKKAHKDFIESLGGEQEYEKFLDYVGSNNHSKEDWDNWWKKYGSNIQQRKKEMDKWETRQSSNYESQRKQGKKSNGNNNKKRKQ